MMSSERENANPSQAREAIESAGYEIEGLAHIPEGRSHTIFRATFADGSARIVRLQKPQLVDSPDEARRDHQFNGLLSLDREEKLMEIVRGLGLPAPKVFGHHMTEFGDFLMVEEMHGAHWSDFIRDSSFKKAPFLKSLQFLGRDLARVHQLEFGSFGDVLGKDSVSPGNVTDFSERLRKITELRLVRAQYSGAFNDDELDQIAKYLDNEEAKVRRLLSAKPQRPVLILTDIHPMNFFVDSDGKPSGYFDLETCQAGLPALEIYNLRTTLLNYFDNTTSEAEEAFLAGYRENGGTYNTDDPATQTLEQALSVGYLVSAATSYFGANDGLRDTWSSEFKAILFRAIAQGKVDFKAISQVFRSKTGQPLNAS